MTARTRPGEGLGVRIRLRRSRCRGDFQRTERSRRSLCRSLTGSWQRPPPNPGAADPPQPRGLVGLKYACHIRDVLLAQRERLFLTWSRTVPRSRRSIVTSVLPWPAMEPRTLPGLPRRSRSLPTCSLVRSRVWTLPSVPALRVQLFYPERTHRRVARSAHAARGRTPPARYRRRHRQVATSNW